MKCILKFFLLIAITNSLASEHFNHRLTLVYAQEYDDSRRWISVDSNLFEMLLQNAERDTTQNKALLIELKQRIVQGIVSLRSNEVLLTQKEFYEGLLKYLPWDGNLIKNASIRIMLNNNPQILKVGTQNFWYPNDVKLVSQS